MPPQKVALSQKTKKWRESCVNSICGMTQSNDSNGRTTATRKKINYDLVNSIMDEKDFAYVTNSYGMDSSSKVARQPARLRDYNLILPKIQLLKGEEIKRPFNWNVISTGGNAVSEKEETQAKVVQRIAQKMILEAVGKKLETDDPIAEMPQTFGEMQNWSLYTNKDIREIWATRALDYIKQEDNLALKFNQGWEHAIISAEEIYYSGIVNTNVRTRSVNPLLCDFDRNPDNPNIEDGDWFKEDRWMTKGQILDEFGEFLTDTQKKTIDDGSIRQGLSNSMMPGYGYSEEDIRGYENSNHTNSVRSNSTHYLVSQVCWKSMKRIGFLNDFQEGVDEIIVSEGFVLTDEMKENGATIDWKWVSEVWEGVKIGDEFIVNVRPSENQRRSADDVYTVKLPYVGMVYNCTNSTPTSIVELIKPHQYMYNIIWFRLEAEIAKAKGKKLIIDIAQIPKSQGIDLEEWMYMFDNVGLGVIDSFQEGTGKLGQGKTSNFNQFTQVDMTLSQSIGQYINILTKIENMVDKLVGISPQREGAISSSETAQGVERSVIQSSNITEPWFYMHNEVKRKVLNNIIELSKKAFVGTKKIHYIADDLERVFVEIDADKYADSDYGVFVSNSTKEHQVMQKLEMIVNQAISSGSSSLSDVIKTFNATSVAELSKQIETSEREKIQREQQAQQQQQEAQQQAQQMEIQFEQEKLDREDRNKELDRENELNKIRLSKDAPIDNSPTDLDYNKQFMEKEKNDQNAESNRMKHDFDREKELNSRLLKEKELTLKEKEMLSKEKMAREKNKTDLKNKVSGEK